MIEALSGREILRWVGVEMALSERHGERGEVLWSHGTIPYLQFISIDIHLHGGKLFCLVAQIDDGSGCYGLHLRQLAGEREPIAASETGIFRTRQISELPLGRAEVLIAEEREHGAITEIHVRVGGETVRIVAGEVHECANEEFRVVVPDESLLLELNPGRARFRMCLES